MSYVTFYRGDPKNAPKTTMGAHLGANAVILCGGKLLLERRRDSDTWGLIGGGAKKQETGLQAIVREVREELGLRTAAGSYKKLAVYDDPGRIAAYRDGSVWRMVIVVYELELPAGTEFKLSAESKELRLFTREELADIQIAVTHEDIVEEWFVNRQLQSE